MDLDLSDANDLFTRQCHLKVNAFRKCLQCHPCLKGVSSHAFSSISLERGVCSWGCGLTRQIADLTTVSIVATHRLQRSL